MQTVNARCLNCAGLMPHESDGWLQQQPNGRTLEMSTLCLHCDEFSVTLAIAELGAVRIRFSEWLPFDVLGEPMSESVRQSILAILESRG
jgi:hypothetical protein